MDSDSTIIMIKALLLSLSIHLIILLLLGYFSFSVPEIPDFPKIRVTFGTAASQSSSKPGESENKAEDSIEQSVPEKTPAPAPAVEAPSEPVIPRSDAVSAAARESVTAPATALVEEKTEQLRIAEDSGALSQTSEAVVMDAAGGDVFEEAATADELFSGSAEAGGPESSHSGDSELPDVSWEGGALYPRSIPEPRFTIPYSASLPEHIKVSFSVQHDGTVISIRIFPPGSGHINLDRQIRAYVADFLFDEFDSSEENRRGTLKLYLKAMGNGGI